MKVTKENFIQDLKPGQRIQIFFNPRNINNKVVDYRGKVDDFIVTRTIKGQYYLDHEHYFKTLFEDGIATLMDPESYELEA